MIALAGGKIPGDRQIDGIDVSPLLLENRPLPKRPFFYYRGDRLAACRLGEWKAHFFTQAGYGQQQPERHTPPALYHLGLDPSEKRNVAAQHPEPLTEIAAAVEAHRANLKPGQPQFD